MSSRNLTIRRPLALLLIAAAGALLLPSAARAADPGHLVVSEFMADPVLSTVNGEYFELFNTTNAPIDVNGFDITDNSATHTINNGGPLLIPAKGFLVVGKSNVSGTNGQLPVVHYVWSTMALGNNGDEITITDGVTQVCRATFDDGDFFGNGIAYELIDYTLHTGGATPGVTEFATLFVTDYGQATTTYNGGSDFGSPGTAGLMVPVELSGFTLD